MYVEELRFGTPPQKKMGIMSLGLTTPFHTITALCNIVTYSHKLTLCGLNSKVLCFSL